MKMDELFFKYIVCESESERNDVIALCELLDLKNNLDEYYDFDISPYVLINKSGNTYQTCCLNNFEQMNISAKDFIRDNF